VLCVTAASLALVIYIFANSLAALYNHEIYKSDVIAYLSGSEQKYLSYVEQLDGVDEVEFIYYNFDEIKIDSKKTDAIVYGFNEGGYRQFDAFEGIPKNVSEGEVVMDKFLMAKKGYKVGDNINITFLSEGYLPIEKTLKITGKVGVDYNAASGIAVIISDKDYKAIYKDHPVCMLAKGKDAKSLKETIEDHSADYVSEIYTLPEFIKNQKVQSASLKAIIILLIVIGVGMTFIGVVSNQLIGLEGRKRECAVMTSVAMPRKKLSKMFLIESFIASVVSLAAAVPIGIAMSHVFMRIMEILENYIPLTISVSRCVACAIILCAVFTFVSLFPIRALKKMDIVSQLKYE
jgi:ABC-type antimicrobial peptide transport system permease subunit